MYPDRCSWISASVTGASTESDILVKMPGDVDPGDVDPTVGLMATTAAGNRCVAIGSYCYADGYNAFALGNYAHAVGAHAIHISAPVPPFRNAFPDYNLTVTLLRENLQILRDARGYDVGVPAATECIEAYIALRDD